MWRFRDVLYQARAFKTQALVVVYESQCMACIFCMTRALSCKAALTKQGRQQTPDTSCGSELCDKPCACLPSTGKSALHVIPTHSHLPQSTIAHYMQKLDQSPCASGCNITKLMKGSSSCCRSCCGCRASAWEAALRIRCIPSSRLG